MKKYELISFPICPYVQRSVITLIHKKADYEITYIDLENPPEWFDKISPLGKVPVLRIDGRDVLFESAVINEYLDEAIAPRLLPADPLARAKERAWIEFGSALMGDFYSMMVEEDRTQAQALKSEFFGTVARLEEPLRSGGGPYFRGREFSLADAAYAPLFMRLLMVEKLKNDPAWESLPRVRAWAEALLKLPEVRDSVRSDFAQLQAEFMRERAKLWA